MPDRASDRSVRTGRPLIAESWHAIEQSQRRLASSREALDASRLFLQKATRQNDKD